VGGVIGRTAKTSDANDDKLIHFEIASLSGLVLLLFGTIIL